MPFGPIRENRNGGAAAAPAAVGIELNARPWPLSPTSPSPTMK